MKITNVIYPSAIVVGLFVSGCAPRTNSNIERAQNDLIILKNSPIVATRAPRELQDANQAVQRAENNWRRTHDSAEAEHLSYLAEKRIEIAKVKTNQELAESEAVRLSQARDVASVEARASLANKNTLIQSREMEILGLKNQLSDLKATEGARGLSLTLSDVLFETDRAVLKPGAIRKLDPLVTYIVNHPREQVIIEGHTDNVGTASFNLDLSSRRAEAVQKALVANGVNSSRIITRGMGEQYPLASNSTEAGRLMNRRVEVIISNGSTNQIIR
jgi:outer membrane protein OmpA-like peptidoglycan-associated protein